MTKDESTGQTLYPLHNFVVRGDKNIEEVAILYMYLYTMLKDTVEKNKTA